MSAMALYLDESGTHQASQWCVMAGHLGSAADWGEFVADWNALRNRPEFGGVVCHATDLFGGYGDFKDWPLEKRMHFVLRLMDVIVKWRERIGGFAVAMPKPLFYEIVGPTLHPRMNDPYFICLGLLVSRMTRVAEEKFEASMIACFADQKKEFEWRGREFYKAIRSNMGDRGRLLDEELNYRSKELMVPLQAADLLVHALFKDLTVGPVGDPLTLSIRGEFNRRLNSGLFIEPPTKFDKVFLQAMATGNYDAIV